jgi:hypothetical protein
MLPDIPADGYEKAVAGNLKKRSQEARKSRRAARI